MARHSGCAGERRLAPHPCPCWASGRALLRVSHRCGRDPVVKAVFRCWRVASSPYPFLGAIAFPRMPAKVVSVIQGSPVNSDGLSHPSPIPERPLSHHRPYRCLLLLGGLLLRWCWEAVTMG